MQRCGDAEDAKLFPDLNMKTSSGVDSQPIAGCGYHILCAFAQELACPKFLVGF